MPAEPESRAKPDLPSVPPCFSPLPRGRGWGEGGILQRPRARYQTLADSHMSDTIDKLVTHWVRPEIRELSAYHVQPAAGLIKLDAM